MAGTHCHKGLSLILPTGSSKEEKILKGLTYLGAHVEKGVVLRDRNKEKSRERQKGRDLDELYMELQFILPIGTVPEHQAVAYFLIHFILQKAKYRVVFKS